MRLKIKNYKFIIAISLIIVIGLLSVVYATISTNLNISGDGTASQKEEPVEYTQWFKFDTSITDGTYNSGQENNRHFAVEYNTSEPKATIATIPELVFYAKNGVWGLYTGLNMTPNFPTSVPIGTNIYALGLKFTFNDENIADKTKNKTVILHSDPNHDNNYCYENEHVTILITGIQEGNSISGYSDAYYGINIITNKDRLPDDNNGYRFSFSFSPLFGLQQPEASYNS